MLARLVFQFYGYFQEQWGRRKVPEEENSCENIRSMETERRAKASSRARHRGRDDITRCLQS